MNMNSIVAVSAISVMCAAALLVSCGGGGGGGSGPGPGGGPASAAFEVRNGSGAAVVGATVYLIPAGDVDGTPITGAEILNGAAENRDEPLEDQARLFGANYTTAVTDANGRAEMTDIADGMYFFYVEPALNDNEHIPGGKESRVARSAVSFLGTTSTITLSSKPSATATYTGSSTCLVCHGEYITQREHAHRLGFAAPGNLGVLQDASRYADFTDGWNNFLPSATFSGGTKIYFTNYDPTRGFDKFKTKLGSAPVGETVYVIGYLWRDTADQNYKITLQNVINPADPMSPRTLEVPLTYGGAVYKQRNLVKVPGRRGLYPFLQIQPEGNESRFDRTRKVYRDYHLDWFWNPTTNVLKDPPLNQNFDAQCTACHSTGFQRFQDTGTGEYLTDAVDDISGEYDIDQNGTPDEINLGCEVCHGPGSDHTAWASNLQNSGRQARFIVNPSSMSSSRETMMCGKCHDRPIGNGPVQNEEPINPQGRMALPGISRAEWLAQYTTRKGPASTDYWADDVHSKSHHQQYSDFIKSKKYRNDRILVTCTSCHTSHGEAPFEHHLTDDPGLVNSFLCQKCHAIDPFGHMQEKTGSTHGGNSTRCTDCHMHTTAKSGAGILGITLGLTTGNSTDDAITYFENDISSHRFDVPRKTHVSVSGVIPAAAMPIPYTKGCGALCHDASTLSSGMSTLGVPQSFTVPAQSEPEGTSASGDDH